MSTALLDIYAERGSTEAAGRILDEYKSSVTWNAMISLCAKSRSPELCYVATFGLCSSRTKEIENWSDFSQCFRCF